MKTKDKYDDAIEYLRKNPEEIYEAWLECNSHEAGCLFRFLHRNSSHIITNKPVGCPIMVKTGFWDAPAEELTRQIRADKNIPDETESITVNHLKSFAKYQRIVDKMFKKKNS